MRHSITTIVFASLMTTSACTDADRLAGPDPEPFVSAHALVGDDYCDGATMPAAECGVLVHLYNTTGGDGWNHPVAWGVDPNPCVWQGIECSGGDHGSVTTITLIGDNLVGAIPPEIGQLSSLTDLRLGSNDLGGPLPQELANLHNLVELELTANHHTGPLPAWLGTLSNLRFVFAYDNDFSGPIPAELADASSLEYVILTLNDLSGPIPSALGTLTGLIGFRAGFNQLSGVLPAELAALADGMTEGCALEGNPGLSVPDVDAYRALDTDGDQEICGLPFSSAEDVGEDAIGGIGDLVPDPLTEGLANALTTKIENAMAKAANGQYRAAINQMRAFIAQLQDLVANGVLTQMEADPFLAQADALIALWTAEL